MSTSQHDCFHEVLVDGQWLIISSADAWRDLEYEAARHSTSGGQEHRVRHRFEVMWQSNGIEKRYLGLDPLEQEAAQWG